MLVMCRLLSSVSGFWVRRCFRTCRMWWIWLRVGSLVGVMQGMVHEPGEQDLVIVNMPPGMVSLLC